MHIFVVQDCDANIPKDIFSYFKKVCKRPCNTVIYASSLNSEMPIMLRKRLSNNIIYYPKCIVDNFIKMTECIENNNNESIFIVGNEEIREMLESIKSDRQDGDNNIRGLEKGEIILIQKGEKGKRNKKVEKVLTSFV